TAVIEHGVSTSRYPLISTTALAANPAVATSAIARSTVGNAWAMLVCARTVGSPRRAAYTAMAARTTAHVTVATIRQRRVRRRRADGGGRRAAGCAGVASIVTCHIVAGRALVNGPGLHDRHNFPEVVASGRG